MDEKIRVLISNEVPRIDDHIDMHFIFIELNAYVKSLEPKILLNLISINTMIYLLIC